MRPTDPATSMRRDAPEPFVLDGLVYALDRAARPAGGKVVVTVRSEAATHAGAEAAPLVDRVDLYAYRARRAFAQLVADTFGRETGQTLGHLALVLDALERAAHAADQRRAQEQVALTPERRAAADDLLGAPDLLERAADVMTALGHVGEERVKRLCYLVATSRLLERPLSALLLAPPGAGKSAVLDATAALVPPEQVLVLARLTSQALFYAGDDALRHKLLVVDEYEGQAEADHAVRVLQSRGELSQTATVSGRAESFRVRGPVAVMSGTTATDLDLQNTSRCLELALDDSPEQTRRVHEAQARAWAGPAGQRPALGVWHDAQRVLADDAPLGVRIPFATRLVFPARVTTDRRRSAQVLGLVAAHAALHARQRERDAHGQIVATLADYRAVHALLASAELRDAAGELSPRAARAYRALAEQGDATRRNVADRLGWGYNTAKRALDELVAHELAKAVDRGPPARYRVLERDVLHAQPPLAPPDALD